MNPSKRIKYGNAWRTGFLDALHGLPSRSPFPKSWWNGQANRAYEQGYNDGLENRKILLEERKAA